MKAWLKEQINNALRRAVGPRMVYGWRTADGRWLAHTRVANTTRIENPELLVMADHVYVGHHNWLDASGGLHIGQGVQITSHCAVLTHSSHQALRIAGQAYWGLAEPPAFVRAPTHIGPYSFVGPHSVLAPGSTLGRGVLVRAFSYVQGSVPDFAVVAGQPAQVVGDTREADAAYLAQHPQWQAHYSAWAQASGSQNLP
jgi:acetyltransferase-like isoleucine patch superfamily enzyme